ADFGDVGGVAGSTGGIAGRINNGIGASAVDRPRAPRVPSTRTAHHGAPEVVGPIHDTSEVDRSRMELRTKRSGFLLGGRAYSRGSGRASGLAIVRRFSWRAAGRIQSDHQR